MGLRKHSEDDNYSGTPKFVQKKWYQATRTQAAANKAADLKSNKKTNGKK